MYQNKVTLIGFLGSNPEVRTANNGSFSDTLRWQPSPPTRRTTSTFRTPNGTVALSSASFQSSPRRSPRAHMSRWKANCAAGSSGAQDRDKQRVWEIRVASILKLDRAEKAAPEDQEHAEIPRGGRGSSSPSFALKDEDRQMTIVTPKTVAAVSCESRCKTAPRLSATRRFEELGWRRCPSRCFSSLNIPNAVHRASEEIPGKTQVSRPAFDTPLKDPTHGCLRRRRSALSLSVLSGNPTPASPGEK